MSPSSRHRVRNILHTTLLIAGMAAITWVCVAAIFGPMLGLWAIVGVGLGLLFAPRVPKQMILSLYRARPLTASVFPDGAAMLARLARDTDLEAVPRLYYLPSAVPNAFAIGSPRDSAVVVSDGLLRTLNGREFFGVLAHEVSHIAHRDLRILGLADLMARLTSVAAAVGIFFLFLNIPLVLIGEAALPWILVAVLIFSPTLMSLLQLGLSRAREYDADLGAARLTGDPMALASALRKLDRIAGRAWEQIVLPGRRNPNPSLLRTHPPTEERIARLAELAPAPKQQPVYTQAGLHGFPRVYARPRFHRTGVWF